MPYNIPADYQRCEWLIGAINAAKPAFSIHVGDIKSGSTPCSDDIFRKVLDRFATFEGALVYTPGDNEWTDYHREPAGSFDPLERLAAVRAMFYANPGMTLGRQPMKVESQALTMAAHNTFVENQRFERNGVLFATVHVVGSNNGFEALAKPQWAVEYFERDRANVAWIDDSVKRAVEGKLKGLVIAMQADSYVIRHYKDPGMPRVSSMTNTVQAIERAEEFQAADPCGQRRRARVRIRADARFKRKDRSRRHAAAGHGRKARSRP
jgi:hypothetical protein